MNRSHSNLLTPSFDELHLNVRKSLSHILKETEYYKRDPEKDLKKLIDTTQRIGDKVIQNPQIVAEVFKSQWQEFISQKRNTLDKRAVRYLCWDSKIALDPKFIHYIDTAEVRLSSQSIYALVRACHMNWDASFTQEKSFIKIKELVITYRGPSHLLNKWQANINMVLGTDSTSRLADEIVEKNMKNLSEFFKQWGMDVQSKFTHEIIVKAAKLCRKRCNNSVKYNYFYIDYYINQILEWNYWKSSIFKTEIAEAILSVTNNDTFREKLQAYVLNHQLLGDPRLLRNTNWAGMQYNAKEQFISWLSRRDIVFFFEHVLPRGSDRHGRKNFWLKYIKRLIASRPLLSDSDQLLLKPQMQQEKINYGRISGTNSAFILDFGNIVAVEFSKVGACYLYQKEQFDEIVDDLFANSWFTEQSLKDRIIAIDRVVHRLTVNCDWRDDVASILARYGIRPD